MSIEYVGTIATTGTRRDGCDAVGLRRLKVAYDTVVVHIRPLYNLNLGRRGGVG